MQNIRKYLRKEVKDNQLSITTEEKIIIEKIVKFYFDGILEEDVEELNLQRIKVKKLLDISFYKEVAKKIEKIRISKILEDKQKSFDIVKILLSEDIETFDELSEISTLPVCEIKKIFQNQKLILEYGDEIFVKLGDKISLLEEHEHEISKLKEQQRREIEKKAKRFKQYDKFLSIYLNSRYRSSDVPCFHNNFIKTLQTNIVSDSFREYYPIDIIEQLRVKGEELKHSKTSKNKVIIRDERLIKIVKPEIIQVEQFILTKLELVSNFFEYFGNIERMANDNKKFPSYNSILSSLMLPELEEYLTLESYLKLNKYLNIEKNYQSLNYTKRIELVRDCVIKYAGNIYYATVDGDEEELALRMLSDKFVKQIVGEDIYNKILTMLNEYSDKKYVIDELNKVKMKALKEIENNQEC